MLNSCHPLFCAPPAHLREPRASLSRSYGGKLPSSFNVILSSALVYSTSPPVSVSGTVSRGGYFPGRLDRRSNPVRTNNYPASVTTRWLTIVRVIPIDYAFRPRLRGRLTLRRLTLRRNPWTCGDTVFHSVCRYSCQHSHFPCLQDVSRLSLQRPRERSATACTFASRCKPKASARGLSPGTSSAQKPLLRPVSCYAFFKGWLLLSQPPGCFGIFTSFPT